MAAAQTYLVTGANKGIGYGMVTALLLRKSATVIAVVRDPNHQTAIALHDLPRAEASKLIIAKCNSSAPSDAESMVKDLINNHNIVSIDVVIANAGMLAGVPKVVDVTPEELLDHFTVNTVGVVMLYQATQPLLMKSKNPRFIATSGLGGSIAAQDELVAPLAGYGPSRAALNWLVRKIHFEEPEIISVMVDPGLVDTDTGKLAVELLQLKDLTFITAEQSAKGYLKVVDTATKSATSGHFIAAADGSDLPW